ncbi:uncharacterized protein LOC104902452 [Beta vulgaris subsp. vulgaris]|uniref:uncharacterized protein LOC104902452 n=1 Tax=Beta vulgaris subsp. vulgaris TaxID=3555 RepID=UPI002036C6ED|nr:uncharacterized protein LOC104902452 [Beta vulgaris subsp. vulgaris]
MDVPTLILPTMKRSVGRPSRNRREEGSRKKVRGLVGGRGKNKRFWTPEEDKALVAALSDLASDPHWKCNNGFRNGYMTRLEELIGKAIPGCGLKALPHIDSRLKTLVTKFRAIVQMLNTSGFKWDDERHMISVERTVYDEYCKIHPNCKNLYGHIFPHLNAMVEIYGKDYAIGKPTEGFVDAIENMEKSAPVQVMVDSSDDDDDDNDDVLLLVVVELKRLNLPLHQRK